MQVKRTIRLLLFFVVLRGTLLIYGEIPQASEGVFDLRFEDFLVPYALDGEWEFQEEDFSGNPVTIRVPGYWTEVTGTPYAAGEYGLTIRLPDPLPSHLSLLLPEYGQIVVLSVNGNLVFESGSWTTGETGFSRRQIPIETSGDIQLSIRLKNAVSRNGGLYRSILFGTYEVLSRYIYLKLIWEAVILGIFISVAVFHLFLYSNQNLNKSSLLLGGTALLMAVRVCVTGESFAFIFFPGLSWLWGYRIDYLACYLVAVCVSLFSLSAFPQKRRCLFRGILGMIAAGLVLFCFSIFLPIQLLSRSIFLLQSYILAVFIINLAVYLSAVADKKRGAYFFLLGGSVFFVLTLMDMASVYGILNAMNASQLGMVLFVMFQGMFLASQYRETSLRAELMTHSLETKVAQRTQELENSNQHLKKEIHYRKRMETLLRELSMTDPLTGIYNRLLINEELQKVHHVALRYGTPYGIIMFDVDYFKKINDRYGHTKGDQVLKELVAITQGEIRDSDIFSRWGGEEFLILMPQITLQGAVEAAERIRGKLENAVILEGERVTASFGVVAFSGASVSLNQLLNKVDELLYTAKKQGRNSVAS